MPAEQRVNFRQRGRCVPSWKHWFATYVWISVFVTLATPGHLLAAQKITGSGSGFAEAEAVVRALESGNRPTAGEGAFVLSRGGYWDTKVLSQYVDVKGVAFEDVNRPKRPRWSATRQALLQEVVARKGSSFYLLTYAAYRIATARHDAGVALHAQLVWKGAANGATLVVENSIRLYFRNLGDRWVLTKVELFEEQGE